MERRRGRGKSGAGSGASPGSGWPGRSQCLYLRNTPEPSRAQSTEHGAQRRVRRSRREGRSEFGSGARPGSMWRGPEHCSAKRSGRLSAVRPDSAIQGRQRHCAELRWAVSPSRSTDCSGRADGSRLPDRAPVQRSDPRLDSTDRGSELYRAQRRVGHSRRRGRPDASSGARPGRVARPIPVSVAAETLRKRREHRAQRTQYRAHSTEHRAQRRVRRSRREGRSESGSGARPGSGPEHCSVKRSGRLSILRVDSASQGGQRHYAELHWVVGPSRSTDCSGRADGSRLPDRAPVQRGVPRVD